MQPSNSLVGPLRETQPGREPRAVTPGRKREGKGRKGKPPRPPAPGRSAPPGKPDSTEQEGDASKGRRIDVRV